MAKSQHLAALTADQRADLENRLLKRQTGKCFICSGEIDLHLHQGKLDVDHIDPLLEEGIDAEVNFALTHADCNRRKGTSNLWVAKRLVAFQKLQDEAKKNGERGVHLGHVLAEHRGSEASLRLKRDGELVRFTLSSTGDPAVREAAVHHDKLSGMDSIFVALPIEYLHHDDRINPRTIGSNIRGLIEEFQKGRPQLQVALAWWAGDEGGEGRVKVFDGQHKAAAQVLLGATSLPVRVFLHPNADVLLQANTNAGGKLKQVAFDVAVVHHLGSSLYAERVKQYQKLRSLAADDFDLSEADLVGFFKGEQREMRKYILDAQKDAVIRHEENRLREFVNWAGKGADLPLSYSAIDRSFFKVFLAKQPLKSPIGEGVAEGENPRQLEREQLVRLMTLWADTFLVDQWDRDIGGRRLENKVAGKQPIPPDHLRAWRVCREEIIENILKWVHFVMISHYSVVKTYVQADRVLQTRAPDVLWDQVETFLQHLRALPCWVDTELSQTVFGPKQNLDYWETVFNPGDAPNGISVLSKPFDFFEMIEPIGSTQS